MKLSDLVGVFHKRNLEFVSATHVYGDYYEINLKSEAPLDWRAGEHGIFRMPSKEVEGRKWRAFSIASVPEEGVVKIGTRTGTEMSSFKKALIESTPGDEVVMHGPFGWFTIQDETTPMVLIAGGVGITPIRALMKTLAKGNQRDVALVYGSDGDFYLFEEELKAVIEKDPKMALHEVVTNEETQEKIEEMIQQFGKAAYYYVSGSPGMLNAINGILDAHEIPKKRIITDQFFGY